MMPEAEETPLPTSDSEPIQEAEKEEVLHYVKKTKVESQSDESIPLPNAEPEVDDTPAIEKEFRALVQELLEAGVDPSEMMSDVRMEDINERALAQNFETWPVFMQNGKLMRGFKDELVLG